jgi:DNA repair exonuclease SbcCD ATPase subunit
MAEQEYEHLRKALKKAEKNMSKLYQKVEKAKQKMLAEKLSKIEDFIPAYTKKLERLKKFMDDGFNENQSMYDRVEYGFKKVDTYLDDYHDPMPDPLDFKISEYDLLGISEHMEIIFYYSNEALKDFIETWMKANVDYVRYTTDVDGFYGFKH